MISLFLIDDTPHIPKVLIFEGDSLSDLNFSNNIILASQNIVLTGWATIEDNVYNVAVGGQRAEQAITQFPTEVLPKYDVLKDNIVIFWMGTNDLYNGPYFRTGAQTYEFIRQYWDLCKTNGFKVIANTIISRGTWDGVYDLERKICNALIRANWTTYCNALVDLDADSRLGGQGANLNTTYFYGDTTHLNKTGQNVVFILLMDKLNSITYQVKQ